MPKDLRSVDQISGLKCIKVPFVIVNNLGHPYDSKISLPLFCPSAPTRSNEESVSPSPFPADSFAKCDVGVKCPKLRRPLPAESVMDRFGKHPLTVREFLRYEKLIFCCLYPNRQNISEILATRMNTSRCDNGRRFSFQLCRNNEAVRVRRPGNFRRRRQNWRLERKGQK